MSCYNRWYKKGWVNRWCVVMIYDGVIIDYIRRDDVRRNDLIYDVML